MGYRFSLVLNRIITDDEMAILRDTGCAQAVFGTDKLPTNAEVTVTKLDFDDTVSPSLADAIQSGLDAVMAVPELSVPGLTVPAQPAGPVAEDQDKVIEGEVVQDTVSVDTGAEDKTTEEKPVAKKPAAKRASTKRTTAKSASGDDASAPAAEPVGAAAG